MDDVLSLWDSFEPGTKALTLLAIITYLTTLFTATYWTGVDPMISVWLLFWPFILTVWATIVWFGFTLVVMFGMWAGQVVLGVDAGVSFRERAKKIILFVPVVIGSVISVSRVFMADIFTKQVTTDE